MAADKLKKVRTKFVEKASMSLIKQLLDDLLDNGILNDGQKDSILEENGTKADRARNLIDVVKAKGNKASEILIASLESRDSSLFSELGLSSAQTAPPAAEPKLEPTWSTTLLHTTDDFCSKLSNRDIYPASKNSISNRVALLITNIKFTYEIPNRNGAEKDEENMEILMKGLGYEVVKHRNLTAKAIDEALKEFAKHPKLKKTDSVLVVLMSHCGVDWKRERKADEFPIDNIYKHLGPENCPALLDKPKIIIIQACRGGDEGAVVVRDGDGPALACDDAGEEDIEDDNLRLVNKEKDFSSLLSCTPDTVSYRHPVNGSFLIQYVVEVFNTFAREDHVEELFRKVMQRFEDFPIQREKQMPTKDRCTLTKHFYFFPGL
uniref:caspase a n=1 Tax=Gasterosteus aculeatus aculeatus TaxID=481459 RepID=UPI001A986370|nr:caspase a [Gasterosteus aculeatus aculeatus]